VAAKTTFIRFVVGADGQHHRELTGIVTEVRFLRDDGRLAPEEVVRLEDAYACFNEHVPVPPFATAGWPRDVVTWFKDDAIGRMWDLVALLREHSVEVRLLRSTNPGRVLYEDDDQVVSRSGTGSSA
jgi:hypothetical protein